MASDDRTERPTARRLKDARKRGQVARSQDLGQAAGLAAALGVMGMVGPRYVQGMADALATRDGADGRQPRARHHCR